MSHKPTPYSPNFPPSRDYALQSGSDKAVESYPLNPQAGYPGPPPGPMPSTGLMLPPGAQPLPGMQSGFHPGMQPGFHPGMQSGFHPGMQSGLQTGYQPGFAGYPNPQASGYPAPVTQQPVSQGSPGGWMSIPQGLSNCPRGLEYLTMIDQLLVEQNLELLEIAVPIELNNNYNIKNSVGQNVYTAVEKNDCCTRCCFGPMRPFDIQVMDNFKNEVIHINRPLACDSCWCPCWLQTMEVSAPPGTVIGSIEQEWSLCKPCYAIKNAAGDVVLKIKGPLCTFSLCGNADFPIYSSDGETKVGKITKQWSGFAREMLSDADYFGIIFPMDLDVKMKAVLLGACFLIDYMFFESSASKQGKCAGSLM